jgi:hypothetical protein
VQLEIWFTLGVPLGSRVLLAYCQAISSDIVITITREGVYPGCSIGDVQSQVVAGATSNNWPTVVFEIRQSLGRLNVPAGSSAQVRSTNGGAAHQ